MRSYGQAVVFRDPGVRSLGKGDYFGEISYFGDSKRSVSVVATAALHVMVVSWEAFVRLAQSSRWCGASA